MVTTKQNIPIACKQTRNGN